MREILQTVGPRTRNALQNIVDIKIHDNLKSVYLSLNGNEGSLSIQELTGLSEEAIKMSFDGLKELGYIEEGYEERVMKPIKNIKSNTDLPGTLVREREDAHSSFQLRQF